MLDYSMVEIKRFLAGNVLAGLTWVIGMYSPLANLLISAGILSTFDITLGILRSVKLKNEKINSSKFFNKFKNFSLFWTLLSCSIIAGPAFEQMGYPFYTAATYAASLYIFYELLGILNKLADFNLPIARNLKKFIGKKAGIDIEELDGNK